MASTRKGLDISGATTAISLLIEVWKRFYICIYVRAIKEQELSSNKILYGAVITKFN